jgi:hypothetical protein
MTARACPRSDRGDEQKRHDAHLDSAYAENQTLARAPTA